MDSESSSLCESSSSFRTSESSSCASEVVPVLLPNGFLNLSNKQLTKLPANHDDLYAKVLSLNVSSNRLRRFEAASKFVTCMEIDASQNELITMKHFEFLHETLEYLKLFDNKITVVDGLQRLVHLKYMDLSHNRIEYFPSLEHSFLFFSHLNLSHNRLKCLPNLVSLPNLTNINLSGNFIKSILDAPTKLPRCLESLDLGNNLISDLCEVHQLAPLNNLNSLTFLGNLCVKEEGRQFNYRPFVYSCILGNMVVVDGTCLTEEEIIKGEWLHTDRKGRFQPGSGSHNSLCAYLQEHCLQSPQGLQPLKSFSAHLLIKPKVLEKRRQYQQESFVYQDNEASSSIGHNSPVAPRLTNFRPDMTPSPVRIDTRFRSPIAKTETKPKRNSARDSTSSPSSSASASTVILSQSEGPLPNQVEVVDSKIPVPMPETTPVSSRTIASRTSVPESCSPSPSLSSSTKDSKNEQAQSTSSTPLFYHSYPPNEQSRPTVAMDTPGNSRPDEFPANLPNPSVAASTIQRWWRRSVPLLAKSTAQESRAELEQSNKLQEMQLQLDELANQKSLLITINEAQTKTINEIADKVQELESAVKKIEPFQELLSTLIPAPVFLSCDRQSPNSLLLKWDNIIPLLSMVDGYEVFLNDVPSGKVVARNKRAIISDVDPEQEYKISIQSISKFGDLRSLKSEKLIVHPWTELEQEADKENISETSKSEDKKGTEQKGML